MVRTARGEVVDWDLMRIQTTKANNVTEKVEIAAAKNDKQARRERRAKMDMARKLLQQAEAEKTAPIVQPSVSTDDESADDNGWDDSTESE